MDDKQSLIHNLSRRLQKLKEKQALLGFESSPQLLIEIEDIEEKIAQLRIGLEEQNEQSQHSDLFGQILERKMKYYLYISQTKVNMLYAQLPPSLQIVNDDEHSSNLTKLAIVHHYIEKYKKVGTIKEPETYISGILPLRYGVITEYASDIAYFGDKLDGDILSLIGASNSLIGAVQRTKSNHTPFYYTMMFLNRVANANVPVDSQPDYYSYKEASQIALKCIPPERYNLDFLAKVLYREENLIVATPLYVALS